MTNIVNVVKELEKLGSSSPTGAWSFLKSKDEALGLMAYTDEEGRDYLSKEAVIYLRSIYQRLLDEPSSPNVAAITIADRGFNSSDELKGYLTSMLRKYKPGQSLQGLDREFLADLISRNPKVKEEIGKYGNVVDLIVKTKSGHQRPSFHIVYSNGREQNISMGNYINPNKTKLVDVWGEVDKNGS